ncbi:MAG: hypothetical protein RL385_432 [Pseudomonadota bacterium]
MSTATCQAEIRAFEPTYSITASQLCARGSTAFAGTCNGDSGSPLYGKVAASQYVLAGLVSYGRAAPNCAIDTTPSVFTSANALLPFIAQNATDRSVRWAGTNGKAFASSLLGARMATTSLLLGDFNADGKDDEYYYNPGDGDDQLFIAGAAGLISLSATADYQAVVGDFDGNGYDDIFWYGRQTDADKIWLFGPKLAGDPASQPFHVYSHNVSIGGTYTPVVGDFDGNGKQDLLWYAKRVKSGVANADPDLVWYFTGAALAVPAYTAVTVAQTDALTPVAGDFNRDGRTDVFWHGPGAARDYLWLGTAARGTFNNVNRDDLQVTGTDYAPFAGDFDGNGYADIFWYRPGPATWDGVWWFAADPALQYAKTQVAVTADELATPVVGDFTGPSAGLRIDDIVWHRGDQGRRDRTNPWGPNPL